MEFFGFLKKFRKNKTEKVKLSELEDFIKQEENKNTNKQKEIIDLIKNQKKKLINNLQKNLQQLSNINVEEKRAEERIKFLTKQGLEGYINTFRNLIGDLKNLPAIENVNGYLENINSTFFKFNKNSYRDSQKATILIGKEIEGVEKNISNFFKNIRKILGKSKELIQTSKILPIIKEKINQLNQLNEKQDRIKIRIKDINEKIQELKDENQKEEQKIKSVGNSQEHKNREKLKQEIEDRKYNLNKKIYELKDKIDFKFLADLFHKNQEKMQIIKDYKEYFNLIKEDSKGILKLFDDVDGFSKEKADKLKQMKSELIKGINGVIQENGAIKKIAIPEDKTKKIRQEIEKRDSEIKNFEKRKAKENKNYKKSEDDKNNLVGSIKKESNKINFEIEDVDFDFKEEKQKKVTLLLFVSSHCPHCPKAEVVVKRVIPKYLNLNFRKIRMKAKEGKELFNKFNVMSAPTILILNNKDEEIKRIVGVPSETNLRKSIERSFLT